MMLATTTTKINAPAQAINNGRYDNPSIIIPPIAGPTALPKEISAFSKP